ncbi:MAG TPA: hypothetical protein DCO89_01665 [Clostridiales bacterium]|nr:hypothetical protein [Clostridiales bacterium]
MKKSFFNILVIFCLTIILGTMFSGCEMHEHTFSEQWTYDATHHWHEATCEHIEEVKDKAEHSFGTATYEKIDDVWYYVEPCEVCEYAKKTALANGSVVAIEKMGYASLNDAIENYEGNGEIVMLENINVTSEMTTQGFSAINLTKDVKLNLNGKTLTRVNAKSLFVITNDATLQINGKTLGSAINGTILAGYSGNDNGNVVIDGGTYTATVSNDCEIQTNGTCNNSNITARNATFNSTDDTFYLAGSGKFKIDNCTINGYTGIYMKAGDLEIKSSTINATGNFASPVPNGNGANSTGDGIILDSKNGYIGNMILKLDNVSITSQNGYAIHEALTDVSTSSTVKLTIENNGTFTSAEGKETIKTSEAFTNAIDGGNAMSEIKSGTYSSAFDEKLLAMGYELTESAQGYVVREINNTL